MPFATFLREKIVGGITVDFSQIASAVGGTLVLIYLIWQVVIKFLGEKDWFAKRRKERLAREEAIQKERLQQNIKEVLEPMLQDIKDHNKEQDRKLSCLVRSSNDMMRAEIVKIYYRYSPYKKILQHSRELLEKLFHDYHDQGGNSFIEGLYNEMKAWPVVSTEEDLRK